LEAHTVEVVEDEEAEHVNTVGHSLHLDVTEVVMEDEEDVNSVGHSLHLDVTEEGRMGVTNSPHGLGRSRP
jgi:hypothetical protein